MGRVNIILSAFNGEKFLPCQLDSLLAQDYSDFRVLVRDDGSSDATPEIVRRYARADPRVVFVNDGAPAENLGYRASFLTLLRQFGDADFFAFCDQDDFWRPEKVRIAAEALESAGDVPALHTSSYDFCDGDLRVIGAPPALPPGPPTLAGTLFYNSAFGFTVTINRPLRDLVLAAAPLCPAIPHDKLCAQLAVIRGRYLRDDRKAALYRRHGDAVTVSTSSLPALLASWLKHDILGSTITTYREQAAQLLGVLERTGGADDGAIRLLARFAARPSAARWLKSLFFPHRLRPTPGGEAALRLAFALGK